MALDEKIRSAQEFIRETLSQYSHPIIMWSGGKDSTGLLHLMRTMGHDLPVLFHREPFNGRKYSFANRLIEEWNLTTYDYAPITTAIAERNGQVEIVNFYQVGERLVYLPTGIREPEEGKPYLCGLRDLYCRPLGTFLFPWDVAFVAHKSTDVDPILGPVELFVDIKKDPKSCDYAFPLRYWTDQDVWEYHEKFGVPFNAKRYDQENVYKESADIEHNNDYHHACVLCMLKSSPPMVDCPKFGMVIPNLSAILRRADDVRPDYCGKNLK